MNKGIMGNPLFDIAFGLVALGINYWRWDVSPAWMKSLSVVLTIFFLARGIIGLVNQKK